MKLLARISRARAGLIELIGVALLLALAVNLISGGLAAWLGLPFATWIGVAITAMVLSVVVWSQFRLRREVIEFHGFIPIWDGLPVAVPGYALARDVERALRAVMTENEALKRQWHDGPLVFSREKESVANDRRSLEGGAARLLREALEYALLEQLSTHLGAFFDSDAWLSTHTKELERDDLLELLPQNRILEVLSRPVEDRIALLDPAAESEERSRIRIVRQRETPRGFEETLVSVMAGDHLYQRLDLVVPRDVTVKRVAPGCVRLEGRYMRTELGVQFEGYGFNLDPVFVDGYLGLDRREFYGAGDRGRTFKVTLTFAFELRLLSLFSLRAWRLHRWAEDFAETARAKLDGEAFLDSISWKTISATVRTQSGIRRSARARARARAETPTSTEYASPNPESEVESVAQSGEQS